MKKLLLFPLFVFAFALTSSAAVRTAVTGDWETAGSWTPVGAPTCGDTLIIPDGITVTVTAVNDYHGTCVTPAMRLDIYGTLQFQTGKKLKLPCGSIVAVYSPNGNIQPGSGSGNSNEIEICGLQVWEAGDGPVLPGDCFPKPSCQTVLPIKLLSFSATVGLNYVNLTWTTLTEINNDYFSVEKTIGGINFETIATVDGAGNSTQQLNYETYDENPTLGVSYYRLKQTDFDGKFSYSKLVAIEYNVSENISVTVFPNPSPGVFYITSEQEITNVEISNTEGGMILNPQIVNSRSVEMDFSDMPKGIYLLKVTVGDKVYSQKVIIQ